MKSEFKRALLATLLCLAALSAIQPTTVLAINTRQPFTGLTLEQTLAMGLKARRPVEFRYVQRIAALVASGELPQSMVIGTFIWARKQPGRPLQKFDLALRERAKKKGIRYTAPSTL
jgi:hypothetical protein